MPPLPAGQAPRGTRYELTGIVDVISSVVLGNANTNPLVQLIQGTLPNMPQGESDLIVDYKAGRRPASNSPFASQFQWQVQTYAWLRSQLPHARPVGAGILIYINELSPSQGDLKDLRDEIAHNTTDIVPVNGSQDYYALNTWQPGNPAPQFTQEFLFSRAIKVIDVSQPLVLHAVGQIDTVVTKSNLRPLQNITPETSLPTGQPLDRIRIVMRAIFITFARRQLRLGSSNPACKLSEFLLRQLIDLGTRPKAASKNSQP